MQLTGIVSLESCAEYRFVMLCYATQKKKRTNLPNSNLPAAATTTILFKGFF